MNDERSQLSIKEIKTVSLAILRKVHTFCNDNGIHYSLSYGTLIGAIRHGGFIPWDDDIDIMMPRPDYDRFCKLFHHDGLGIISEHDTDCYINFCRVYDTDQTIIETKMVFAKGYKYGIWIDIFPVDGAEETFELFSKRYKQIRRLFEFQCTLRAARSPFFDNTSFKEKIILLCKKVLTLHGMLLPIIEHNLVEKSQIIPYGSTDYCALLSGLAPNPRRHHISDFNDYVLKSFEGDSFWVIAGYDRFLRDNYNDYMLLPPEDERVTRHGFLRFFWK